MIASDLQLDSVFSWSNGKSMIVVAVIYLFIYLFAVKFTNFSP